MDEKNNELLPCAHCGGAAHLTKGYATEQVWEHGEFHRVFCGACQVRQLFHRTPDEAIAAWNRRATQASSAPGGEAHFRKLIKPFLSKGLQETMLLAFRESTAHPANAVSAAKAEPCAPHILEALSWHRRERDDLTLEEAVEAFRHGYHKVRQRDDRAMLAQIIHLMASAPVAQADDVQDAERYRKLRPLFKYASAGMHGQNGYVLEDAIPGDDLDFDDAIDALRTTSAAPADKEGK